MLILKLEIDLDYCPQPTARNICCRVGWLVGRLVGQLAGPSVSWLVGRLVGQSLAILGQEDGPLPTS